MTGLWVVLGALVVASGLGWWLRARDGRVRTGSTASPAGLPAPVAAVLDPSAPVTLVQLSTTFCASCRQVNTMLTGLASGTTGLRHVELDVTDQPAVATTLGIMRTPTTLALTPDGRELLRVGGVPRRDELLAALRPHLP